VTQAALNATPYIDVAERGAAYRSAGWSGFDAAAAPYTEAEMQREREISSAH
jgi:hypothetical protein